MNNEDFEFNILKAIHENKTFVRLGEMEVLILSPTRIEINNVNKDMLYNSDNFTTFNKLVDPSRNSMTLVTKDEYINFDKITLINSDEMYKRLFSYNLPSYDKCIVIFLYNLSNVKEMTKYLNKLDSKFLRLIKDLMK